MIGLMWLDTLLASTKAERSAMKRGLLEGIKHYGAKITQKALDKVKWHKDFPELIDTSWEVEKLDSDAEALYKDLKAEVKWQFIGFAPNTMYVKEKGPEEEMGAVWVHPYAVPALVYKHKSLPIIIYASPTIELDKSVLEEIDANLYNGLTSKGKGIMG